jgi:hypothetical protein
MATSVQLSPELPLWPADPESLAAVPAKPVRLVRRQK